jgi:hypothetical protein
VEAQELKWLLALCLSLSPLFVKAGTSEPVGHYYLEGVRETGSELMLNGDGHYQWYLTYGALDQYSAGRWQRTGAAIILTSDGKELEGFVPHAKSPFETMTLRIEGNDLIPENWRGRYARH